MSGYTPGKWVVHPGRAWICPAQGLEAPIAAMKWPTNIRSEAETMANAQLMAASPKLLESTEWLLWTLQNVLAGKRVSDADEAISHAQKAIALATGETR